MNTLCRDCLVLHEGRHARCPACASGRCLAHAELTGLTMAHVDCDAFYASVEKRDRPELRDHPVIVGGERRGVVTTACYVARLYGVRSAMPMFKALKACPDAIVVKPDFTKYRTESRRIFEVLGRLTPLVQSLSLDEAWLDLAGTERLNGGPPVLALARAQAEIERETGLTVSVGLAANKFLAKIASDLDKPRGFSVIGAAEAKGFLAPKPVGILPGVGAVFARTLHEDGFRTVGDLAQAEPKDLARRYGVYGLRLSELAQGRDVRHVDPDEDRKSVSAENTFNEDLRELPPLEDELWPLCEKVAGRMRRENIVGQVITLKLKTSDFKILTRRRTLGVPTQTAKTLFACGRELLKPEADGRAFRLIGIGLSDLLTAGPPSDLFGDGEAKNRAAEQTVDRLRSKFGAAAVVSGRALKR